jgi:hypothetical protein
VRAYLLIGGLAGAAVLYALSRTQAGQAIATDVVGGVVNALKPRGIRNNNPGNIEWMESVSARWRGMIARDGRFGVFDTPANGVRAIGGELKASIRKGHTIEQAIHEWAPPTENNTAAYVKVVAEAARADKRDRLTTSMLPAVALAIIKHENGQQPYDAALVQQWVYS